MLSHGFGNKTYTGGIGMSILMPIIELNQSRMYMDRQMVATAAWTNNLTVKYNRWHVL